MIHIEHGALRALEQNIRVLASQSAQSLRDIGHQRRNALAEGQAPFAIVLGCSDSRVPAEIVFDQGLGDLFVIRVAGNIVAPSQIGSVEFAVERFDTRLVVVLGHSRCGAIEASPIIRRIVSNIIWLTSMFILSPEA